MDWECEWRHARKRWTEDLGIWKKAVNWDLGLDGASWLSELVEARQFWVYGIPARWLSQWVESWWCTNSQYSKKLCLSLMMTEILKLKKVNKNFVPERRKSSVFHVFFGFLCVWTFYEHYERWMYMYITRLRILVVFLDVDMLQLDSGLE